MAKHWTQTKEGRKRMSEAQSQRWAIIRKHGSVTHLRRQSTEQSVEELPVKLTLEWGNTGVINFADWKVLAIDQDKRTIIMQAPLVPKK